MKEETWTHTAVPCEVGAASKFLHEVIHGQWVIKIDQMPIFWSHTK
jgi:hypothetical protein